MTVVTVNPFKKPFLHPFMTIHIVIKTAAMENEFMTEERLKQNCERISIGSYNIHLGVCRADNWS